MEVLNPVAQTPPSPQLQREEPGPLAKGPGQTQTLGYSPRGCEPEMNSEHEF